MESNETPIYVSPKVEEEIDWGEVMEAQEKDA